MRVMNRWLLMAAVLFTPLMALAELEPGEPKLPPELPPSDTNSCVEGTIAGGLMVQALAVWPPVVAPVGLEFRSARLVGPCLVVRLMGVDGPVPAG